MSSFLSSIRRQPNFQTFNDSCPSCMIRTQLNDYDYETYIIDSARRRAHECDACLDVSRKAKLQKLMKKGLGVRVSLKTLLA